MTEVITENTIEHSVSEQNQELIEQIAGYTNRLQPITDLHVEGYELKDAGMATPFYERFGLHADVQIDIGRNGIRINILGNMRGHGKRTRPTIGFYLMPADIDPPAVTVAQGSVRKKDLFYATIDDPLATNEQLLGLAQLFSNASRISHYEKFKQARQYEDPGKVQETLDYLRVTQVVDSVINFGERVRNEQIGTKLEKPSFEISEPGVYYFEQDTRHPHPGNIEAYVPDPNLFDQYTIIVSPERNIFINKSCSGHNRIRIVEADSTLNINAWPRGVMWVSDHSQIEGLWQKLVQTREVALKAALA